MTNDLISRQAVNDALDKTCDIVCQYSKKQRYAMCGACPLGNAFDAVANVPSVDAVEVVRCKNCKWYDPSDELCLREGMVMDAEDFCSRGEQNDD